MCFFGDWEKLENKERLKDDMDIPEDFGLLGVYLIACSPDLSLKPSHKSKEIVYIGLSTNVHNRLDKQHKAINKIKQKYKRSNIYFATYFTNKDNWNLQTDAGKVNVAHIHYIERKLIWEFAHENGKLPEFNNY